MTVGFCRRVEASKKSGFRDKKDWNRRERICIGSLPIASLASLGMESCGGSRHWALRLIEIRHQVTLMPARFVKAFNIRNKNDAGDGRMVRMATLIDCKPAAVKTKAQQAALGLHRLQQ